ncbi:cellulose biosynthesis protein BcsN [Rhizobium sp. 32-5/1]|uniref:cellulose biosynthesis protein BcsN n=1 Tax=Rhizobium sp. 32-5/1 TaxID=3019602 RepID=UPI00240E21D3|nr:cellulose biosynthesis protein BcsN [Rhizobium sp. 32-5/1]WEZ84347.1 cellulose biosynthesis protein BcsN [Rhizobium sp. 32-5/1]
MASSVSPEFALGSIPVIGSPATAVRQTARKNYAQQTIVYGNATDLPGENTLVVTVGAPGSEKGFARAPSAGDIRAEIATAFSGVDMKISNVIGDNAYGTYGYAAGTTGKNGSCIYAWQLARNISARDGAGFSALGSSKYAAQVRLRYCAPSTSVEQLVGLMNGLRLKPVTAGTFDMLRSAGGQGFAATTSVPVLQPVVQQAAIATEPAIQRKRVRRAESLAAVEAVQEEPVTEDQGGIKNAAKIPLPGAAADKDAKAAMAVVQDIPAEKAAEAVSAQTQIAKPSLIPLPGAVAATE